MLKKLGTALAGAATAATFGLMLAFIAANWVTNCQSWDREQWTSESSCVAPADVWQAITGG
ncbi:hypothetical protein RCSIMONEHASTD_46 [Rhodobacter phage RcSimone-Hastad]|nr:hypothetical protein RCSIMONEHASTD_46 [Rhodobacter phage RcSimone-Hastad]